MLNDGTVYVVDTDRRLRCYVVMVNAARSKGYRIVGGPTSQISMEYLFDECE